MHPKNRRLPAIFHVTRRLPAIFPRHSPLAGDFFIPTAYLCTPLPRPRQGITFSVSLGSKK